MTKERLHITVQLMHAASEYRTERIAYARNPNEVNSWMLSTARNCLRHYRYLYLCLRTGSRRSNPT